MIEKLEIISAVCNKNKKFKIKAEGRITKLEEYKDEYVQRNSLNEELQKIEFRINNYVREQLSKQSVRMDKQEVLYNAAMSKFERQIEDYRNQVLWRIRDCEELLK